MAVWLDDQFKVMRIVIEGDSPRSFATSAEWLNGNSDFAQQAGCKLGKVIFAD